MKKIVATVLSFLIMFSTVFAGQSFLFHASAATVTIAGTNEFDTATDDTGLLTNGCSAWPEMSREPFLDDASCHYNVDYAGGPYTDGTTTQPGTYQHAAIYFNVSSIVSYMQSNSVDPSDVWLTLAYYVPYETSPNAEVKCYQSTDTTWESTDLDDFNNPTDGITTIFPTDAASATSGAYLPNHYNNGGNAQKVLTTGWNHYEINLGDLPNEASVTSTGVLSLIMTGTNGSPDFFEFVSYLDPTYGSNNSTYVPTLNAQFSAAAVTSAALSAGTVNGTTSTTATPLNGNDTFSVRVASTPFATPYVGNAVPGGATAYTLGSNISGADATTNKYIGLYELDSSGNIVRFSQLTVISADINHPTITGYYANNNGSNTALTTSGTVAYGTSEAAATAGLSTTGYAELSDDSYVPITITWAFDSSYDGTVTGSKSVTGTVSGAFPSGQTPTNLTGNVTVSPDARTITGYYASGSGSNTALTTTGTVAFGTSEAAATAGLSTTGYAEFSDDSYVPITITWAFDSSYDGSVTGSKSVTGTVSGTFAGGQTPTNLTGTVTVSSDARTITGYYTNNNGSNTALTTSGTVAYGTSEAAATAGLSTTGYAKLSDDSYVPITITWAFDSSYDGTVTGSKSVTGTVNGTFAGGQTPTNLTGTITVSSDARTITGYYADNSGSNTALTKSGTVAYGTSEAAATAGLSTTGYAKLSDDSYVPITITWAFDSSYDGTVTGSKAVTGTVNGTFAGGQTPTNLTGTVTVSLNTAKAITAFALGSSTGTINQTNHTIAITVPYGTDVTSLVAMFTTTGSSVDVLSTTQVSGTTANDFTTPVTYTVTAADLSTQDYIVTVTVRSAPSSGGGSSGGSSSGGTSTPAAPVTINGGNTDTTGTANPSTTATITASNTNTSTITNVTVTLPAVTVTAPASVLSSALGDDDSAWLKLSQDPTATATQTSVNTVAEASGVTPVTTLDVDLTRYYSNGTSEPVHQLSGNITVTINLTAAQIALITNPSSAQLLYFDPTTGTLTNMNAVFNLTAGTATFQTNHFSTFVIATGSTSTPTGSKVGVSYDDHMQTFAWQPYVNDGKQAGNTVKGLRLEAVNVKLTGDVPTGASITYQAHVQSKGWQAPVSDGLTAGTTGKALRLEALKITLSGMTGYEVKYRVYVQGKGWMAWQITKNGTAINDAGVAGTTGKALKAEAVEIIVEKSAV